MVIPGYILVVTTGGRVINGIQWVGARDVANHPTMHETTLRTEKHPDQNVNSAGLRNFEMFVFSYSSPVIL